MVGVQVELSTSTLQHRAVVDLSHHRGHQMVLPLPVEAVSVGGPLEMGRSLRVLDKESDYV